MEASDKSYSSVLEEVSENIDLTKDVLELSQDIIPKLISKTLFIHSTTFPQIKKHISKEKMKSIRSGLKTFLDQSRCYLDTFEDPCQ